jgi:hypothetical protein
LRPVEIITDGADRGGEAEGRHAPVLGAVETTARPASTHGRSAALPAPHRHPRRGRRRGAVGVAALRAGRGLGRNLSAARGATDERHGTLPRWRGEPVWLAQRSQRDRGPFLRGGSVFPLTIISVVSSLG